MRQLLNVEDPCPSCKNPTKPNRVTVERPLALLYFRCLECGTQWEQPKPPESIKT